MEGFVYRMPAQGFLNAALACGSETEAGCLVGADENQRRLPGRASHAMKTVREVELEVDCQGDDGDSVKGSEKNGDTGIALKESINECCSRDAEDNGESYQRPCTRTAAGKIAGAEQE